MRWRCILRRKGAALRRNYQNSQSIFLRKPCRRTCGILLRCPETENLHGNREWLQGLMYHRRTSLWAACDDSGMAVGITPPERQGLCGTFFRAFSGTIRDGMAGGEICKLKRRCRSSQRPAKPGAEWAFYAQGQRRCEFEIF